MENKKVQTFACIIIAVFFGVIIYLIVGISSQIHSGNEYAKKVFSKVVYNLNQVENISGYMSREYKNALNASVENNATISAVIVTGKDKISYAYPLNSKLVKVNNSGLVSFSISSSIMQVFTASFEGNDANISMAMYLITPNDIYRLLRIAFLIVLVGTLLTVIILIFLNVNSKKLVSSDFDSDSSEEVTALSPHFDTLISSKNGSSLSDKNLEEDDSIENSNNSITDTSVNSDSNFVENDIVTNDSNLIMPVDLQLENNTLQSDDVIAEESLTDGVSDPLEVYSLNSGVSQEKDLGQRLDTELSKAASAEYDVSLLLFQINGVTHQDFQIKKIVEVLLKIYNNKDLIFEYKDNAFAIIFLDTNLNDTMTLAEKFYSAEKEFLNEKNIITELGLGISTRSIRIMPSSRLILEAQQALDKSFEEEELPIVAFQVDPEKYRQCLRDTV